MVSGGLWMSFIFMAIGPVLSTMANSLQGDLPGDWIAQMTMTMPDIGIIVGGPIAGFLIERVGLRVVAFNSFALFGIAGSAGLFIDNGWLMLLTRLILGFAGAGITTSTTALIAARFYGEARARTFGYWSSVGAIGGIGSALAAGRLASVAGWHSVFGLYALVFISFFASVFSLPKTRPPRSELQKSSFSVLSLWPIFLIMLPIYVVTVMTGVQISFLLQADGIVDPLDQSWIIATAATGSMVGAWSFGLIQPKLGMRSTFMLFMGLLGIANLIMPLATAPLAIAAGAALNGMGGGMANPYFSTLLVDKTPYAAHGRVIGLFVTTMFSGSFLNPFVIIPLKVNFGIHNAFVIVGIMSLAIGIVSLMRSRLPWTTASPTFVGANDDGALAQRG
jgi:MFS family permease